MKQQEAPGDLLRPRVGAVAHRAIGAGKQKGAPRLPVDDQFQIVQSVLPGELTMAEAAR